MAAVDPFGHYHAGAGRILLDGGRDVDVPVLCAVGVGVVDKLTDLCHELAACACFLTCVLASNDNLVRITLFCFMVGLLLSSTIDIEHGLLPDQITLPLLWTGLIVNLYLELVPLGAAVLGAILGYASLWLLFWIYKFLRGQEAFGYGDFKLLAATGAWFGFQAIPNTLLYASISGLIWALLKGLIDRSPIKSVPFGPFISLGIVIYILSSNSL